ncbi:unnamed protein product [Urochloa humidicola]
MARQLIDGGHGRCGGVLADHGICSAAAAGKAYDLQAIAEDDLHASALLGPSSRIPPPPRTPQSIQPTNFPVVRLRQQQQRIRGQCAGVLTATASRQVGSHAASC